MRKIQEPSESPSSKDELILHQGLIPFALSAIGNRKLTKYVSTAMAVGIVGKSIYGFLKAKDSSNKYTEIKIHENQDFFEYVVRWLSQVKLVYQGSDFDFVDLNDIVRSNGKGGALTSWEGEKSPEIFNYKLVPSGTCKLFFENIEVKVTWEKMTRDNNNAKWVKDYIIISAKSKDQKFLDRLISYIYELGNNHEIKPKTVVHTFVWSWKSNKKFYKTRDVVLPNGEFTKLKEDLSFFLENRDWYESVQVPYRRGYLLHGIAGGGKGTTVQAIATHFNLDVYVINLSEMTDDRLMEAISYMPDKSILLLEDVECAVKVDEKSRDTKDTKVSFSGLLNILDGLVVPEGRITFLTTNFKERLDPTLLRAGRVDYEIEYFNASREQIFDLAKRFKYKKAAFVAKEWAKEGICMAEVQNRLISLTRLENKV